jgi:nitrate reductase gamma subunit
MAEHAEQPSSPSETDLATQARRSRWILAGAILGVILVVGLIIMAIYGLTRNATLTSNIRDIFLIFMALESLIIGVALIVLIVQVASLINLLQNEVRPILKSTSETVNTLRGTTEFLSENLVEPVIKLNSSLAGFRKIFNLLGLPKK